MATKEKNKLSTVKKQVEKMIKTMQDLETKEKSEAVGYLRKYLDDDKPDDKTKKKKPIGRKNKIKNRTGNLKRVLFKCKSCGSSAKTKILLLKHLETHMGTPMSCTRCRRSFNSRNAYTFHLHFKMCKNGNDSIIYNCDQCPKFFRYKRHYERHMEGHKRNNCTYCDVKLTRREQLVEHLQTVHSIKLEKSILFTCQYCEKRYVKKRSLFYHLKQHAENKIVCMECGKMSGNEEEHNKHFLEHDKDRPWKCDRCNDRFSRRQQYLVHVKRHERYKCVTCNVSHASKIRILRHKQRGHTVQGLEPQFKCPHCPTAFQRRFPLQIHMKKHNEDKPMYCKYCDKSFRTPYLYFKHCASTIHEIHSPEKKQLVCEICGNMFMKKYQLEQHLQRVHNQNKQSYNCEFCTFKTTCRMNITRHMALHLESKKECICEQCGKAFYNLNTLKDHMSYVHLQTRQFKCTQCDKAFKRNSELVRHQTTHSEVRPHVCKTCGTSYKRVTHLRRHEQTQHGTKSQNRRVQRLQRDETGTMVPVQAEKKTKPNGRKKPQSNEMDQQVFSIMDAESGEMVTFSIPEVESNTTLTTVLSINNEPYNIEAVTIPYTEIWNDKIVSKSDDIILNNADILLTNDNVNNIDLVEPSISNHILTNQDEHFLDSTVNNFNILEDVIPVDSAATCDILLPNENLEQSNQESFLQNPYQFL